MRYHLVDQAEGQRLVGGDDALAHDEVERPRQPQVLDQQVLAALVRQQGETQGGAAHAGAVGGEAEVAGERQREAGLDGNAVDRGDGQLVEVAQGQVQRLRHRAQTVVGADRGVVPGRQRRHQARLILHVGGVALKVVAGAERLAGADEHDDAHVIAHLRLCHHLDQVALHRRGHAVHAFGPVELDPGDARLAQRDLEAAELACLHGRLLRFAVVAGRW